MNSTGFVNRRGFLRSGTVAAGLGVTLLAADAEPGREQTPSHIADLDVRRFGAKGDGKTLDTLAIQAAIDACAKAKGGRVVLAAGTFLSRTLRLRSNVTLFIDAGAVLQGTANLQDYEEITPEYGCYTYSNRALIYAERAINVSILGKGAIDLSGTGFPPQTKHTGAPGTKLEWGDSPYGVHLLQCSGLTVRDVTIRNCPMAALRVVAGRNVVLDAIHIDNRVRISCDGIEVVSSHDVTVSNCHVNSWDDGICIKSASPDLCRNIAISNCTVRSLCNSIKLGTESNGGFENIVISNCTIEGGELNGWRSINGLALMIVDGGRMNRIRISDIVMQGVRTAIFIHLGNRARPFSPTVPVQGVGRLSNVVLSHISADVVDGDFCCSVSGLPGHPVEDIVLEDVRVRFPGGHTSQAPATVAEEKSATYPESLMFGPLPAYGLYCRHVRGLNLRNVAFELAAPDHRPAIQCDDVEHLSITGFEAANVGQASLVRLIGVRDALVQNCRPTSELFLSVERQESSDIALLSNDLRHVAVPYKTLDGAGGVVLETGNLKHHD